MRLSILGFFLFPVALFAQVPQAFEFQGVARDLSGNVLVSQPISLRLGIVANTSGGALVYQETQAVTTSPLGLFTVQVGNGTPVLGTFAAATWTAGPRFLKVELDPAGGSSYQLMGTTQLLSVPYALAAGAVPCFTVSATGDTLRQGNGCYVIIPGLSAANPICTDADGDGYFSLAGCGTAVDCNDGNPAIHPGVAEVCDGIDNNCSGAVDEGNPDGGTACSTGGVGVCAAGTTQCVSGAIICVANTSPSAEVCNGLDDDCDGIVDDGSTCPLGQTCSAGQCQIGITNEVEPNGTIPQADVNSVQIAGPQNIVGAITPVADLDFYRVSNPAEQVWRFETFDNSGTDCTGGITSTLRFRNNAGTQLVIDVASGISGCSAIAYTVPAGTYYIQAEEAGNNSTIPAYRMHASVIPAAATEVEPNDIQAQATVLSGLELFATGNHSLTTDVDWYAITVPAGNSVRAEIIEGNAVETCESNGIDTQIILFTSAGAQLVTDDDNGRGFCSMIDGTGSVPLHAAAHNLAAGTYFLRVQSSSLATGAAAQFDYKLVVTIR